MPVATLIKGASLEDIPALIRYFSRQLSSLGVNIQLGQTITAESIHSLNPEAIIVATGGQHVVPEIPGIYNDNVITAPMLYRRLKILLGFISPAFLRKLTRLYLPVGKKVVIIGGGIQGCELAEFLTKRGRQVTIVDKAESMGDGMVDVLMGHLFMWFDRKGVNRITGAREYVQITNQGLEIINREGDSVTIPADTIIPAMPLSKNDGLYQDLKKMSPEVYAVGDCGSPGLIADAIGEGSRVAINI